MSIVFAEGFDEWAYANRAQEGWTVTTGAGASAPSITTGRRASSSALSIALGNSINFTNYATHDLPSSYSTIFVHMAGYFNRPSADTRAFLSLREGTTPHLTLCIKTDGNIEARRGDRGGTLLGTSTGGTLPNATWVSIEVKLVVHDSAGTVDVMVNGVSALALSGQDTRNGGASGVVSQILFGESYNTGSSSTCSYLFDDVVVYDTTGSVCSTWTGDIRVDTLLPTGAGSSTQFTPSTGSNYACVDETSANTSDYVDSSTAGHIDYYAMGDLSHTPTNIYGVYATALATKDDAGARSLKLKALSNAVAATSASLGLTNGSWVRSAALFETDPNTSAAWGKTALNAAEFGLEVV